MLSAATPSRDAGTQTVALAASAVCLVLEPLRADRRPRAEGAGELLGGRRAYVDRVLVDVVALEVLARESLRRARPKRRSLIGCFAEQPELERVEVRLIEADGRA